MPDITQTATLVTAFYQAHSNAGFALAQPTADVSSADVKRAIEHHERAHKFLLQLRDHLAEKGKEGHP